MRSTATARPPTPIAATLLTALVGVGMLAATCAGAAAFGGTRMARAGLDGGRSRRAEGAKRRVLADSAQAQLDGLADRVAAEASLVGELPEMLAEAPPKDPWGAAVLYERVDARRALLRSAGPDGKVGTRDDVRRDVVLR
jgi:hypothetical protein